MGNYKSLQDKRKVYYSQNGEDGLLEYLFTKIPSDKWAVEFGAWDAKYLSNTFHFIENHGYSAVLIEGDPEKMPDLETNTRIFGEKVHRINAFVEDKGENTLDKLLKQTPIPHDFDILSVDIDGNDYYVWEAFTEYKPKVVIIEINIKDKPEKDHIHDKSEIAYQWGVSGSGIKSLTDLAHKKGYSLLANVACNAIYVDSKYLGLFFDQEPKPEEVYTYEAFDLSDLNLKEAARKGSPYYWQKLLRYPLHLFKYGK